MRVAYRLIQENRHCIFNGKIYLMENTVKLDTKSAAFTFVDTVIRKKWEVIIQTNPLLVGTDLGKTEILERAQVGDHQVWQYAIEELPTSRDGRKRWVLDTGDTFDTTLDEDANTLEKALAKQGLLNKQNIPKISLG